MNSRPESRGARSADDHALTSVLACPRCSRAELQLVSAGWICDVCGAGYPVVGDVPWLLREPQDAIAEWRARLALLTRQLGDDASRADRELARLTDQSEDTAARLASLISTQASIALPLPLGTAAAP